MNSYLTMIGNNQDLILKLKGTLDVLIFIEDCYIGLAKLMNKNVYVIYVILLLDEFAIIFKLGSYLFTFVLL